MFPPALVTVLRKGGIGVIPTDTLYGIVAVARNRRGVKRLYALRRETARKPFIVLVGSISDLGLFGVRLSAPQQRFLRTVWPGKVSVLFPCPHKHFAYLHLGTGALAFRCPRNNLLQGLLRRTGPLVAPSANRPGKPPAMTISEARAYFKEEVDMYVSAARRVSGKPSTLVALSRDGAVTVLRQGAVRV